MPSEATPLISYTRQTLVSFTVLRHFVHSITVGFCRFKIPQSTQTAQPNIPHFFRTLNVVHITYAITMKTCNFEIPSDMIAPVSLSERLRECALQTGKLFTALPNQTQFAKSCEETRALLAYQPGFVDTFIKKKPLTIRTRIDSRAVVSAALFNQHSEILEAYANKLPIMTLNVGRLMYTIEAFDHRQPRHDRTIEQSAIEFYMETDLRHSNKQCSEPNRQFSELLHRLRSNGYPDYIFDLARILCYSIDWIVNSTLVKRYKILVPEKGFLTVIQDADRWFVKTSLQPIITECFWHRSVFVLNFFHSSQPLFEHVLLVERCRYSYGHCRLWPSNYYSGAQLPISNNSTGTQIFRAKLCARFQAQGECPDEARWRGASIAHWVQTL